jgi:outer membrane receptor protein involved in Fe transport
MISGAALAAVSASGANAQTDQAAPAATTSVQELVVTGSRIPSKNLTSVSPVTTINSQQVKLQGTTNVEDLINNLPQAFADFGQFESNGATGTATIDLRGLGNKRTLVLVDGKRMEPGDPFVGVPDINMIPPALIDRVEVLTGGASAVYGSDAVSGVVNFILKHNYEGLQLDAEFSIGEHGNGDKQVQDALAEGIAHHGISTDFLHLPTGVAWAGARWVTTITGGANTPDDKGNVEFYMTYTHIDPVLESKYDWSACGLYTQLSNATQYCSGSVNDATGALAPLTGPNTNSKLAPCGTNFFDVSLSPVNGCMRPFSNSQRYNFAPINYIQRPDIRWQAGEFSHYEIAPWLDIYSSFMFMNDHSLAQIAPSGSFFGDRVFTVPCDDPLLSAAQVNTLCGDTTEGDAQFLLARRNVEGLPRIADLEHYNYRMLIGAKGDLGHGWSYDISAQYGRVTLTDIEEGYLSYTKMLNAIDVVPNPAVGGVSGVATGAPVCAVTLSGQDTACVPWNIWSPGGVTPAALKYLTVAAEQGGANDQQVVEGNIAGDLGQYGLKSPYASDGIGISIGAAYQRDYLKSFFDSTIQSGDLGGAGGASLPTVGSQSSRAIYGEIRIPLIQNVTAFKDLTFEGGVRYSDYTHGGGNVTYKLGLDWQVIPDIRLRGSYERAVRAPSVSELFAPEVPGLVVGTDICAGPVTANTPTAAECYNTVVHSNPNITEAQFASTFYGHIPQCISGQCGTTTGGNVDLKPETAKTYSFGAVFTPTFFRGFSLSVDYFNIQVDDGITVLPLNLILTSCALQDNPTTCALINRDPNDRLALFGGLGAGGAIQTEVNASSIKTSGVDVNADYRMSLSDWGLGDMGGLSFSFTGTYVHDLITTFPGQTYNCAGLFGTTCGTPTPKWRHQARLSWNTPWNLTLSLAWRYIAPNNLDQNTNQPALAGAFDGVKTDAHIPAFSYFDLSFQYKFRNRYTLRGGVNNIFDRTPPLLDTNNVGISGPAFGNANTYPQVYDPLGRMLFVGLTADF